MTSVSIQPNHCLSPSSVNAFHHANGVIRDTFPGAHGARQAIKMGPGSAFR